jgi:hypothetical protein
MYFELGTWEESNHKAAISNTDNPSPAVHVPGRSTAAECTDSPILGKAVESRPEPNSR